MLPFGSYNGPFTGSDIFFVARLTSSKGPSFVGGV